MDNAPRHGEVPGTQAYGIRTGDAVPDEVEVIPEGSQSRRASRTESTESIQSPVPQTRVDRVDSDSEPDDGLWKSNVGVGQGRGSVGCDKRGPLTITREPSATGEMDSALASLESFRDFAAASELSSCKRHQRNALSAATLPPCAKPNKWMFWALMVIS